MTETLLQELFCEMQSESDFESIESTEIHEAENSKAPEEAREFFFRFDNTWVIPENTSIYSLEFESTFNESPKETFPKIYVTALS